MIDLKSEHENIVKDILRQHIPDVEVYVFGSRATLTAKPHSDLDLVIIGKEEIPLISLHLLEEAFDESDLPFRVDVLDWQALEDDFRQRISSTLCRISL